MVTNTLITMFCRESPAVRADREREAVPPSQSRPTHLSPRWDLVWDCLVHSPVLSSSADNCLSDGCVDCSCRQETRMVPVPDGPQHKRTNVCLAGPVETLLQLPGILWTERTAGFLSSPTEHSTHNSLQHKYTCGVWVLIICTLCAVCQALADCVKDLLSPFHNDTIDLVAGIDAMGFILGKKTSACTATKTINEQSRSVSHTDFTLRGSYSATK